MLMVLMALIDLGRSTVGRATRWLWMLLSGGLWLGQEGCLFPQSNSRPPRDSIEDRDVPDAQAPDVAEPDVAAQDNPASDLPAPDPASVDVPAVLDAPRDCPPMAYYGPPTCASDADCAQSEGPGWYCDTANVYIDGCGDEFPVPVCRPREVPTDVLGPDLPTDAPVDILGPDLPADAPVDVLGPDLPADAPVDVLGPDLPADAPVDVLGPDLPADAPVDVLGPDLPADAPVDALGPDVHVDTPKDCPPIVAYGPQPCMSDADCQAWGEGWFCDKANPATDPCTGGSWYTCAEGPAPTDVIPGDASVDALSPDSPLDLPQDCEPADYYGPPPCYSDADCKEWYGDGWVCNPDAKMPDGCGGERTVPTCEPKTP